MSRNYHAWDTRSRRVLREKQGGEGKSVP
jgi:hypothetical protein